MRSVATGMNDRDCIVLLQWALPRLGHRWEGYRRVRRQVCRRIAVHMRSLGLSDADTYRARLAADPQAWTAFAACLWVTISRFFRDRDVFRELEVSVLPQLADAVERSGEETLRAWSVGCASGEENYSLAILWVYGLQARWPRLSLSILATDADEAVLRRAEAACYPASSLREVPEEWRAWAFIRDDQRYCLHPELRSLVRFCQQDLCAELPEGPFHLILCRNLAFTYFAEPLRRRIAGALTDRLVPGGFLVLGSHEQLPSGVPDLATWRNRTMILRRIQPPGRPP